MAFELVPVDGDPFAKEESGGIELVPVEGDPFAQSEPTLGDQPVQRNVPPQAAQIGDMERLIRNVPKSAKTYASDMLHFITHPKSSAQAMGQLVAGFAEKLKPGVQPDEWRADAMNKFFIDRYGSLEAAKETAITDPVGFLADVGTVVTPIGKAISGAGWVTKSSTAAKIGKVVSATGASMDPVTAIGGVVSRGLFQLVKNKPESWYKSAVKFSEVDYKKRDKLIKTALDNNIFPDVKGLEQIQQQVNSLNEIIHNTLAEATRRGDKIPVRALMAGYSELKRKALTTMGRKEAKAVSDVYQNVIGGLMDAGITELTPMQVQRLKIETYNMLRSQYQKTVRAPINASTRMKIANNAKNALEFIAPEIKNLNAKEGALIELEQEIMKTVKGMENANKIPLGGMWSGAGAAMLGSAIGLPSKVAMILGGGLGIGLRILDRPAIKAKLALMVAELRRKGIRINSNHALVRLGLVQLGRQDKGTPAEQAGWKITEERVKNIKE